MTVQGLQQADSANLTDIVSHAKPSRASPTLVGEGLERPFLFLKLIN